MKIGIIGLGYVGLPLAVAFAEEGVDVVAVDIDPRKLEAIAAGESYIEDVAPERLAAASPRLEPTDRYSRVAQADATALWDRLLSAGHRVWGIAGDDTRSQQVGDLGKTSVRVQLQDQQTPLVIDALQRGAFVFDTGESVLAVAAQDGRVTVTTSDECCRNADSHTPLAVFL